MMPDSITASLSVIRDGATAWVGVVRFDDDTTAYTEFALDTALNDESAALLVLDGMLREHPQWFWQRAHPGQ